MSDGMKWARLLSPIVLVLVWAVAGIAAHAWRNRTEEQWCWEQCGVLHVRACVARPLSPFWMFHYSGPATVAVCANLQTFAKPER